jgi:uncharacterized protein (DUF1684 family)
MVAGQSNSSTAFVDSVLAFQKNYVVTHEVVVGKDKKHFRFFAPDADYAVSARFEKITDSSKIGIKTSGKKIPVKYFIRYGKLYFTIKDQAEELTIYQSSDLSGKPEYQDYLFIPFTDATTGLETYGSGRYIDLKISSIQMDIIN